MSVGSLQSSFAIRWYRCLFVVIALLTCATPMRAQQDRPPSELRVLFIGNSYTYFNNIGDLIAGIAASNEDGPRITPTLAVRGGRTLQWHLENGPAMAELEGADWDYVVLQGHSLLGGGVVDGTPLVAEPSAFHASVREWTQRIRQAGAEPVLFMTWARRDALADQVKLSEAYTAIGRELTVNVAPVGDAWSAARTRWLSLDLHIFDGSHPTPAGSYLAAGVLYATLTGQNPSGAPSSILGHPVARGEGVVNFEETVPLVDLGASTATWLQEIAWTAASENILHP